MSGEIAEVSRLLPAASNANAVVQQNDPEDPQNSLLECRVCNDNFALNGDRIPRLLQCGHTLCQSCLSRLLQHGELGAVVCPFDRQITPVGLGGIQSLKKNFALVELLERLQIVEQAGNTQHLARSVPLLNEIDWEREKQLGIPCDENETHVAVQFCTICESHLCLECAQLTHTSRVLSRHRRVPVSLKPQQKLKCPYHSAYAVEFVCLDDECKAESPLMCLLCRDYGRHMKHMHALLEAEAVAMRKSVVSTCGMLENFHREVVETLGHLTLAVQRIEGADGFMGTADSAKQQIRQHFAELRETLAAQETAAVAVLDAHCRERLAGLRQQQEDLGTLLAQLNVVAQELERSTAKDDTKLLMARILDHEEAAIFLRPAYGRVWARHEVHAMLKSIQKQQQQFADVPSHLNLETIIPLCFTKDNRLHIGPKIEMRVVTLGLDQAGKTTILFKLKQNELIAAVPTIGFNVETVEYKNLRLTIWDVGGVPKLRPLWKHYYSNTQALIFVVDSTDKERLPEVQSELVKLLSERELRDASLLVFANKQDAGDCISVSDLVELLALTKLCYGRCWQVQGCCAKTGVGLWEGLDWLARQLVSSTLGDGSSAVTLG